MRSTTEDRYRIDIAFQSDQLLLHVEGPEGQARDQHVQELRRAAERCGFGVVERQVNRAPGAPRGDASPSC